MLVGPMKEAWSSILLRHLEELRWQPLELTLRVREGASRQGSFPALSVEDGHWGGDMGHFCRGLSPSLSLPLLSLQGLSLCLRDELCESFSCLSHCSLDGREHLLQHEVFLLGESLGTFCDGAQGDRPLDLEGSPSLLVELGASPRPWEDGGFSFQELESGSFSSL